MRSRWVGRMPRACSTAATASSSERPRSLIVVSYRYHGGRPVPNLLLRNLEQCKLDALKARAAKNGRSVQQELHSILEAAVVEEEYLARKRRLYEWAKAFGDELTASGRTFGDSTDDIRADRDSDHGRI